MVFNLFHDAALLESQSLSKCLQCGIFYKIACLKNHFSLNQNKASFSFSRTALGQAYDLKRSWQQYSVQTAFIVEVQLATSPQPIVNVNNAVRWPRLQTVSDIHVRLFDESGNEVFRE